MLAANARLRAACNFHSQRVNLASTLDLFRSDALASGAYAGPYSPSYRSVDAPFGLIRPSVSQTSVHRGYLLRPGDVRWPKAQTLPFELPAFMPQHCGSLHKMHLNARTADTGTPVVEKTISSTESQTAAPLADDREESILALSVSEDRYDGLFINKLPDNVEEFKSRLEASIPCWKAQGKKGVWLKVPLSHVDLVPAAIKAGFGYHHADPGYCMLTLWLPSTPSTLPANASHQVGVGAFLLNNLGEVLAVQEKNGPLRGTGIWKLPTGLANHGEDIAAAAVREVKEETGVDAEFQEVLSFRQAHGIAHGKSDLFFVCALRPTSFEVIPQEAEIADAKWMSLKSFCEQPFFADRPLFRTMMDVCVAHAKGRYRGLRLFSPDKDLQYQMYIGDFGHD